jgi:glycerophosphoryl diester phosphodiesterase
MEVLMKENQTGRISEKVWVMAHRGGEKVWPSNTLYAFQQALQVGVDVLEMDLQVTKDGALVIRHDPFVESTTDGQGLICELALSEIKRLDAGYTWTSDGGQTYPFRGQGVTIPTLEEVLQTFPDTRLNIDIKPEDPAVVEPFVKLLEMYEHVEKVMVGSFHDVQLRRFRQLCPGAATAAGVRETLMLYLLNKIGLARLYRTPARAFQVPEWQGRLHVVTPGFIRAAHRHGMEVHVWTVDKVEDMQRLIGWGVDGIITDYPGRLVEVVRGPIPRPLP